MATCLVELINTHPLNGHTAAEVTDLVLATFREQCPEEYERLASTLIRQAIHTQIVAREHSRNQARRIAARRLATTEARDGAVAGGDLKIMDKLYVANASQERKPLGVLTHEERLFALESFDDQIRSRQLERAFLQEIDRRCADRTVAEVLDPDEVNRLFVSIIGGADSD